MTYRCYTLSSFREIPQLSALSEDLKRDIEVVGRVLPFKVNNFVLDHLINWDDIPNDPMFILTFPQKGMLLPQHYEEIVNLVRHGAAPTVISEAVNRIRLTLRPHPGGQKEHNVPYINGTPLPGVQHKYSQTILYFPSQGQTCHAYCTFCFRWPQFTGMSRWRFSGRDIEQVIAYIRNHPEITDILLTGGDPMTIPASELAAIIDPLLNAKLGSLRRIRIGTKAMSYWPFRFLTDNDAEELIGLFKKITRSGLHLAIMAHFNHPNELASPLVRKALKKVRSCGAEVRTQSPLLRHVNDDPSIWRRLWDVQVDLGCIPYYMFVARDTGASHYFHLPLVRAWEIFREAYQNVSGLCRTVRGPTMSTDPGKIQVLGVTKLNGEKVFVLRFLQGRDPEWVHKPFFAKYDEAATWLDEMTPAFGEKSFFFEEALEKTYRENINLTTTKN